MRRIRQRRTSMSRDDSASPNRVALCARVSLLQEGQDQFLTPLIVNKGPSNKPKHTRLVLNSPATFLRIGANIIELFGYLHRVIGQDQRPRILKVSL
jgi:hypothetical protein